MSNILPDDLLFVQRTGSGSAENFAVKTEDLIKYGSDSFKNEIEYINDGLEQEIIDRKDGDDALEIKLDTYRDYVRSGVDLLFPSVVEGDYVFKLSIAEQSTYINRYNECIDSIDSNLPPEDQEAEKVSCYYSAAAAAYNGIADDMTSSFKVLSSASPNYKLTHTLIVDKTTANSTDIDWDLLLPNDYMSIGRHNSEGKSSDTDYGFYKVKKNLTADLGGAGGIISGANPDLYMFELEYQSGNDLEIFYPTAVYAIRGMSDLKGDISGDFVSKTGDTMSGSLVLDNSNIELEGSSAIHFTDTNTQTISKDINSGNLNIQVGADSTIFKQDGSVDVQNTIDTEPLSVVNVGHLNLKLSTVTQDISGLEDDIKILDERIDAAIKVIDVLKYEVKDIDEADNKTLEEWTTEQNSVNVGQAKFYDKELKKVLIVPGTEIHQRIILSNFDSDGKNVSYDNGSINVGDFLEFSCLDGDTSDFTYKVVQFTKVNNQYQFDLTRVAIFGADSLQDNKTYKMKQISSQQALTLDDANTRFVAKTGDTVTGPLLINDTSADSVVFKTSNINDANTFKVLNTGVFDISTDNANNVCTLSSNDGSTQKTTKIRTDGAFVSASSNASYNIYINSEVNPSLTLSTAGLDVKSKKITNVSLADTSSLTDAVNVEYYNKHIKDRFIQGSGISITSDTDNKVTISATGTFSVKQASDVYTNNNTWRTGDIIQYNESMNKFEKINIDERLKGRRLAASNESDTNVGGIWTDGNNFFIRTS